MGALVTRAVGLTWVVRGQISANPTTETLVSFPQAQAARAYLTWKMKGKFSSTLSSFSQKNAWSQLTGFENCIGSLFTVGQRCSVVLKKYGSALEIKVFSPVSPIILP